MSGDLLIYGDPHGDWLPLLRACRDDPPAAVVILGDCDLAQPLRGQLSPIFDAGIRLRWIHGNHDVDVEEWYDRLFGDYPEGHLHARVTELAGVTVAGLGGVFHSQIWEPRFEASAPLFTTRSDFLRTLPQAHRWRGGIPLRTRAAIFPEDVVALEGLGADVLATHEAPTTHRLGSRGVDEAAAACGARMIVHGHHHNAYAGRLPNGVAVRGLGRAEVFRLSWEDQQD